MSKSIIKVSEDVLRILINYSYDGNIRELENIIEHAFVMCQEDIIQVNHLPPEIQPSLKLSAITKEQDLPLNESEKITILNSLNKNHWDTLKTSQDLQIHRSTLWRKMKKYNLS
jgi:transcriptional regulator of acetoin/glycerol metabolism